ncbi:hypothetical protein LJC74_01100 [Eubacteriales bacterium OttesenSCG-928-A19]|nr:hypothetical protein [Eubacteriales bacterium OttesenSCG-928-A19]
MSNTEMTTSAGSASLPADIRIAAAMEQLANMTQANTEAIKAIAAAMQNTNERMTKLERQQALMVQVTSAQANALKGAIRDRARQLAKEHRLAENPKALVAIGNAIRKHVRIQAGVDTIRELPRCEFGVNQQRIAMWDEYPVMKAIKAKYGGTYEG